MPIWVTFELEPVRREDTPVWKRAVNSKYADVLNAFRDSNLELARMKTDVDFSTSDAALVSSILKNAARRLGIVDVKIFSRSGGVYLERVEPPAP